MANASFVFVDVCTNGHLHGSPVPVIHTGDELSPDWMALAASEFGAPDTSFVSGDREKGWRLRILTPGGETPFSCRSVFAAFRAISYWEREDKMFQSLQTGFGEVQGRVEGYTVSFPLPDRHTSVLEPLAPGLSTELRDMLNVATDAGSAFVHGEDAIFAFEDLDITGLDPDLERLAKMYGRGIRGVAVTSLAPEGDDADFRLRYIAPAIGLPEDTVTASLHAAVARHWGPKIGRRRLRGVQMSERGASLWVEQKGQTTELGCKSTISAHGVLEIDALKGDN